MANVSSGQIIDVWAQPVLKDGIIPEVVRLFKQSGADHLLGQDLSTEFLTSYAFSIHVTLASFHVNSKFTPFPVRKKSVIARTASAVNWSASGRVRG